MLRQRWGCAVQYIAQKTALAVFKYNDHRSMTETNSQTQLLILCVHVLKCERVLLRSHVLSAGVYVSTLLSIANLWSSAIKHCVSFMFYELLALNAFHQFFYNTLFSICLAFIFFVKI